MFPVTITPNSVNILFEGRMRTVAKTHLNFEQVKRILRSLTAIGTDPAKAAYKSSLVEELRVALDIPAFIAQVSEGRVQIGTGAVYFDGLEVKGVITERLVSLLQEGHDVRPLARFLDRVSQNPNITARDEIYLFMESGNMPLTEDGCFLAFKKVGHDYASGHLAPGGVKVYNRIGDVVSMPREHVDTDRYNTCSRGLHFCSWQYLPEFGVDYRSDRVVIVKIAPEDVVSIPSDYNNSKGRTWRYVVVGEVPQDECKHLFDRKPVVSSFGVYDATEEENEDDPDYDENLGSFDGDDEIGCCAASSEDDHESEVEHDCDVCESLDDEAKINTDVLSFKHGKKTYTGEEIKQLCADYGQRGVARMTGIPRSTLQGWLKAIG
jgi:hypothetical protein